jgi:hypothetical protein
MNPLDSPEKLILFLLFFLPGFITLKIYEMFTPWGKIDFTKRWLEAIAYSALNFIALSWLIAIVITNKFSENHEVLYPVLLILIGIICPALWGFLYFKLSRTKKFAKYTKSPFPSCWDFFFSRKDHCWVILHLKDGKKVGGKFDTDSYASAYPDKEQIYLEEVWELNQKTDEFIFPHKDSKGLLISNEEIKFVEFIK